MFSDEGVSAKQNKKIKKTARIFICQDFHLFREAEQGVLLKQFLDYLDEKKCLLLLSAPILSMPSGYEQMVEVIDVPGPDEEDIREQLMRSGSLGAEKKSWTKLQRYEYRKRRTILKDLIFMKLKTLSTR